MGKCPNLFEMAWIYRRFTTGQSPYFKFLKYRRKVTNRGKTDVLSKPLKRRIRMGYTYMYDIWNKIQGDMRIINKYVKHMGFNSPTFVQYARS